MNPELKLSRRFTDPNNKKTDLSWLVNSTKELNRSLWNLNRQVERSTQSLSNGAREVVDWNAGVDTRSSGFLTPILLALFVGILCVAIWYRPAKEVATDKGREPDLVPLKAFAIADRETFVAAINQLGILLHGDRARFAHHRRLFDLLSASTELAPNEIAQLEQIYARARYAPAKYSVERNQLQFAKNLLSQIRSDAVNARDEA